MYHIIIIIVKIIFVLATRTTEVGTCVSLNHIDHNHLVLYILSGKRHDHHTLDHVRLDGKHAWFLLQILYFKNSAITEHCVMLYISWNLVNCFIYLHIPQIPLDLSCQRPDVWPGLFTFCELINVRNLVPPGLRQERSCKTWSATWSLTSCEQKKSETRSAACEKAV